MQDEKEPQMISSVRMCSHFLTSAEVTRKNTRGNRYSKFYGYSKFYVTENEHLFTYFEPVVIVFRELSLSFFRMVELEGITYVVMCPMRVGIMYGEVCEVCQTPSLVPWNHWGLGFPVVRPKVATSVVEHLSGLDAGASVGGERETWYVTGRELFSAKVKSSMSSSRLMNQAVARLRNTIWGLRQMGLFLNKWRLRRRLLKCFVYLMTLDR